MSDPMFSRQFQFDLPLFGESPKPWLTNAGDPAENSDKQCRAVYTILLDYSKARLLDRKATLADLKAKGQQDTDDYQKLVTSIANAEQAIEAGTGTAMFPFVNYDDFAFPIYAALRTASGLVTADVSILPYTEAAFEPPWFPRKREIKDGADDWTALDVPQPSGTFRPSGPEKTGADGTVVVYDEQSKIEYDYWQVTTATNASGNSQGGGKVGQDIRRAGSVTGYRVDGFGARNSEVDPSNSCRATGLPYLGGLLLPEDFAAGVDSTIRHALVFSLPSLRYIPNPRASDPPNWVFPASDTERHNSTLNPDALAAGQRIALNDGLLYGRGDAKNGTREVLNDPKVPPIVRIFLKALFDYGAFLVDGGGGFGLAAEDIHTANYAKVVPIDTDAHVKALTSLDTLDPNKTHWEIMIETLNTHLSGWTPSNEPTPLLDGSGLAFAYLDALGFHSNFTVVKNLF